MTFTNKYKLKILKQYIVGWTLSLVFLSIIKASVEVSLSTAIIVSLTIGPFFGAISGFAIILTEKYGYKKMPLKKLLLLRLIYGILFIAALAYIAFLVFEKNVTFFEFIIEPNNFAVYLYFIVVDILMLLLRQINLFLGGNNLWKLLIGDFYEPRDEERIFMFIDLKDSTVHAENLGHIQYSKMIQDCFNDIGVVVENEAEIYQYVGDEVILTWKYNDGLRNYNCINAYYDFINKLESKKDYYLSTYKVLPHFKAGVNSGIVTVTEVGKFKKEIAYHGDTINTASRIQGKCNELKQDLLISESIKKGLAEKVDFNFKKAPKMELKGKNEDVEIYSVEKKVS